MDNDKQIPIWQNKLLKELPDEVWQDIPSKNGHYQASSLGRIKALSRIVPTWNATKRLPTIIMAQSYRENGYLRCKLGNVHSLVAMTFLHREKDNTQVNHKNGVKSDNRLTNLEWCTASENVLHAWAIGLCNDETRAKMSAKAKLRTGKKNPCWRGYVNINDLNDNFVVQVECMTDAVNWVRANTRYKNAGKGNICAACLGTRIKQVYGHRFKLTKEESAT